MDVNEKSLACDRILTAWQSGQADAPTTKAALIALAADPHDADELMAIALGGDDIIVLPDPE